MHSMSKKRRKREREALPVREQLKAEAGRCEVCGRARQPRDLAVHEICRGNGRRLKGIDKPFAVLVVCLAPNFRDQTDCHMEVQAWPEARQLALLYLRRTADYSLLEYVNLTSPRAPNRITQEEVDTEIQNLLAEEFNRTVFAVKP